MGLIGMRLGWTPPPNWRRLGRYRFNRRTRQMVWLFNH